MSLQLQPLTLSALDALGADAYAVFLHVDERPPRGLAGLLDWRLAGGLSRLIQGGLLKGEAGECLLMPTPSLPASRLFVFGLQTPSGAADPAFASAARSAVEALRAAGVTRVILGLAEGIEPAAGVSALTEAVAAWPQAEAVVMLDVDVLRRSAPELVERLPSGA